MKVYVGLAAAATATAIIGAALAAESINIATAEAIA
jgi:hypothetical protein